MVPGAWLGSWAWKKITRPLEQKGHAVLPVTLTGMGDRVHLASEAIGIETAINDVLNVIKFEDRNEVVLVGHSFAGKVVAAVADRIPDRIRMILYLDAFRPEKGVRGPQGDFSSELQQDQVENGGIVLTKEILGNIGRDLTSEDLEWLRSKATPWPKRYGEEPVTLGQNFDLTSSAYIFCTGGGDAVDEILQGKWGKLDGPYKVIESGHWPMITKPEELVEDILALT